MKFGTLKSMCAAAALAAMAVPALAQGTRTNEGGTRAVPNGARGAEGEVGTVRGNSGGAAPGTVGGTVGNAVNGAAGVVREGANAAGRIVREGANTAEQIVDPNRPVVRENGTAIEGQPGRQANFAPGTEGRMDQGRLSDAALARWLIADNEAEVRLGETATQKTQNADVKRFAQEMVNDHGKMVQQLQQVANRAATNGRDAANGNPAGRRTANFPPTAGNAGRNAADRNAVEPGPNRTARAADDANVEANEQPNRDAGRAGMARQNGGNNAAVALHVQIRQKLTQMILQDLQSKKGLEFDASYIGEEIAGHQAAVATLETAQQFASADMKPMLADALKELKHHLDEAKQLMEQLEGQSRTNR